MKLKINGLNRSPEISERKKVTAIIQNSPFSNYFTSVETSDDELKVNVYPWNKIIIGPQGGYDVQAIYNSISLSEEEFMLILTGKDFYDYRDRYEPTEDRKEYFLNGIGKNRIAIVRNPPCENVPLDWLVMHETGHALGLKHCSQECLMRSSSEGKLVESLCDSCESNLIKFGKNRAEA